MKIVGGFVSVLSISNIYMTCANSCQYDGSVSEINCQGFAQVHGKLKLDGVQLVDSNNQAIQLRGLSSHGIQWTSDCVTEESISYAVQHWGVNLYRAVIYISLTDSGYTSNSDYFDSYISNIVTWCENLGVYVIIDWHVLDPGDPNAWLDGTGFASGPAYEFWSKTSSLYKDKRHVLYEIANEPNGESVDWPLVLKYHNAIIDTIRQNDPETIILAGTTTWSQDIQYAATTQVARPYNVMYTFHFYATTHVDLFGRFVEYAATIPLFVSEWGLSNATGDGELSPDIAISFLNLFSGDTPNSATIISWAMWSYSDLAPSSSMLLSGSCSATIWDNMTCSGQYIVSYLQKTDRDICSTLSLPSVTPTPPPSSPPSCRPTRLPTNRPSLRPTVTPSLSAPSTLPTDAATAVPQKNKSSNRAQSTSLPIGPYGLFLICLLLCLFICCCGAYNYYQTRKHLDFFIPEYQLAVAPGENKKRISTRQDPVILTGNAVYSLGHQRVTPPPSIEQEDRPIMKPRKSVVLQEGDLDPDLKFSNVGGFKFAEMNPLEARRRNSIPVGEVQERGEEGGEEGGERGVAGSPLNDKKHHYIQQQESDSSNVSSYADFLEQGGLIDECCEDGEGEGEEDSDLRFTASALRFTEVNPIEKRRRSSIGLPLPYDDDESGRESGGEAIG
jgi:hypothetical protein